MRKFICIVTALVLAISLVPITAFASDTVDPSRPARARHVSVRCSSGSTKMRIGKYITLDARISPDDLAYDSVEYTSNDYEVIDVERYGEVTAVGPGYATVTASVYITPQIDGARKTKIGSGSIEIMVYNKDGTKPADPNDESSKDEPVSPKSPSSTNLSGARISTATLTAAVKKAVIKGTTTKATFKNVSAVSSAALHQANDTMKAGGGTVQLYFDTINTNKTLDGRIIINPKSAVNLNSTVSLGVQTNERSVSSVQTKLQKSFKNDLYVIKTTQSGSYGMPVTIQVMTNSSLAKVRKGNLRVYSYDAVENIYQSLKDTGISIDKNALATFTTTQGEYLIISNGELTIK